MIWNTSELSPSHLSPATAILVVDCCQFGPSWIFGLKMELMVCADLVGGTTEQRFLFSWTYMKVSMIWNTFEISALHLSRATAVLVVDYCQVGPSWIFGLKMELMSCAGLVGGTMEKSWIFLTSYDSINYMKYFIKCLHHTSTLPQPF